MPMAAKSAFNILALCPGLVFHQPNAPWAGTVEPVHILTKRGSIGITRRRYSNSCTAERSCAVMPDEIIRRHILTLPVGGIAQRLAQGIGGQAVASARESLIKVSNASSSASNPSQPGASATAGACGSVVGATGGCSVSVAVGSTTAGSSPVVVLSSTTGGGMTGVSLPHQSWSLLHRLREE